MRAVNGRREAEAALFFLRLADAGRRELREPARVDRAASRSLRVGASRKEERGVPTSFEVTAMRGVMSPREEDKDIGER